ncbi:A-factor biosynthesis hotdog domain-containing protein [Thermomonospora echinospora]|uniref:A-factor biosynthesis hotdog domain-containing protein n=1 Tax=Thermomonospora echinospora TaxID=1992 RepID=A0A1H5VEZ2_9ACTN|nr:AfsA-related hotdog domain-containing protein [Thermomonospora echinospora]SEF85935.1 A-factor biosynthesis hotdog domain-containing protein [Thermomonospora echinospora]
MAAGQEVAAPPADFGYTRTVDRTLVHRAAVSEVFVTDIRTVAELDEAGLSGGRAWVAAQLPLSHAYYSDHIQEPALFDPLLLLEACRQAAICGTHAHAGIPVGTSIVVGTFTLELDDLPGLAVGERPGELAVDTEFVGKPTRRGRLRNVGVEQRLYLGGAPVGRHSMQVMMLTARQYEVLREAGRDTPAPWTTDYVGKPRTGLVEPRRVGRVHPGNVVLADPVREGGAVSARLAPDFANRGLFDHDYDHLPAMILAEAARQLALLALDGGGTGRQVAALTARFGRFAELDAPLTATAVVDPPDGPAGPSEPSGPDGGRVRLRVDFTQNSTEVAAFSLTLADLSRAAERNER